MKKLVFYKKFITYFSGIIFYFIFSCSIFDSDEETKKLVGPTWELTEIKDSNGIIIFENTSSWKYWIVFQDDSNIIGKNACNDCNGNYSKNSDKSIDINISCTEAACSTPSPDYLGYGDDLNNAISYELKPDVLNIVIQRSEEQEVVLVHKLSN